MWTLQCALQVPIVVVGLNLGLPSYSFKLKPPSKCSANAETLAFANFVFLAPFVLGFMTPNPSALFGPSAVGMPPMGRHVHTHAVARLH